MNLANAATTSEKCSGICSASLIVCVCVCMLVCVCVCVSVCVCVCVFVMRTPVWLLFSVILMAAASVSVTESSTKEAAVCVLLIIQPYIHHHYTFMRRHRVLGDTDMLCKRHDLVLVGPGSPNTQNY